MASISLEVYWFWYWYQNFLSNTQPYLMEVKILLLNIVVFTVLSFEQMFCGCYCTDMIDMFFMLYCIIMTPKFYLQNTNTLQIM